MPTKIGYVLDKSQTIGATSVKILDVNEKRIHATIQNISAAAVYIKLGSNASATSGKYLPASGGSYEINLTNPWYGEVYAIAAGAGQQILVEEVS